MTARAPPRARARPRTCRGVRPAIVLNDPALSASQPSRRARRQRRQRARPRPRGPADHAREPGARARRARGRAAARRRVERPRARPRRARPRRAAVGLRDRLAGLRAAPHPQPDARAPRRRRPRPGQRGDAAPHGRGAAPPRARAPGPPRRWPSAPTPPTSPPTWPRARGRRAPRAPSASPASSSTRARSAAAAAAASSRSPRRPPTRPSCARCTQAAGVVLDLLIDLIGALPAGCDYAEARLVEARSRAPRRAQRRGRPASRPTPSAGLGVRARVGGAWGFAATDGRLGGRARGGAGARRRGRRRPAARRAARWAEVPRARAARPRRLGLARASIDPFARLARRQARAPARRRGGAARRPADRAPRGRVPAARARAGRSPRPRAPRAPRRRRLRRRPGGAGRRRRRGADALVPAGHGGSVAQAGWEHLLAPRPRRRTRRASPRRPSRCSPRRSARRASDARPRRRAARAADPRVDRPRARARPHPRRRGVLRRARAGSRPTDLGTLRYGSEPLTSSADATLPGGLGTFGWDDEGVAGAAHAAVAGGVLQAALSRPRPPPPRSGSTRSGGCARADGFARQPIVRMTNVSLEPGDGGVARRPAGRHRRGLYLETNRSWSIDDRRLHFQFGTEVAREIRGRRARPAVPQRLLRGRHAAVLGLARRGLLGAASGGCTGC